MSEITVGQIIENLWALKKRKAAHQEVVEKLELREAALVEELQKFYSPIKDPSLLEVIIAVKRPI